MKVEHFCTMWSNWKNLQALSAAMDDVQPLKDLTLLDLAFDSLILSQGSQNFPRYILISLRFTTGELHSSVDVPNFCSLFLTLPFGLGIGWKERAVVVYNREIVPCQVQPFWNFLSLLKRSGTGVNETGMLNCPFRFIWNLITWEYGLALCGGSDP